MSDEFKLILGFVATSTNRRPSELVEWDSEDQWIERLLFDLIILNRYMEEVDRKWRIRK